jgi:hypothetical protein
MKGPFGAKEWPGLIRILGGLNADLGGSARSVFCPEGTVYSSRVLQRPEPWHPRFLVAKRRINPGSGAVWRAVAHASTVEEHGRHFPCSWRIEIELSHRDEEFGDGEIPGAEANPANMKGPFGAKEWPGLIRILGCLNADLGGSARSVFCPEGTVYISRVLQRPEPWNPRFLVAKRRIKLGSATIGSKLTRPPPLRGSR